MKESDNQHKSDDLIKAVKIVQEAIRAKEAHYKEISETEEQESVLLEGITRTGYTCRMDVDPKDIAKVFLEYQYPIWNVLEEEAPIDMWERLAEIYGLQSVKYVGI